MFHANCPSCGASVEVRSATAVTVVCSYCSSMLVLKDGSLHDTGRDSALLHDFSPIQIGTQGQFAIQNFSVIGRIQAQYDRGAWNEWYLAFDDGTFGWLSEAGDLYVVVKQSDSPRMYPQFDEIVAGKTMIDYGKRFIASDVRHIELFNTTAQGELPFLLPEKMTNQVSDWRCENAFLTLDYAINPPQAFLGRTVKLAELSLKNTRSEEAIKYSAGSLKGEITSKYCPHCGSPIEWVVGAADTVICPSCSSQLDASQEDIKLIEANTMREAQQTNLTLSLGKTGLIDGNTYTVIGAVRYEELRADDAQAAQNGYPPQGIVPQGWWFEYLLYSPNAGFLWLVETSDEWRLSRTMNDFPRLNTRGEPQGCYKLYDYGGRVSFAAGAFYWQIRAGDVNVYYEYRQGNKVLSAEVSREELAWSQSEAVAYSYVKQWLNKSEVETQISNQGVPPHWIWGVVIIFCVINIPAWLMMSGDDFFTSVLIDGVTLYFLHGISKD